MGPLGALQGGLLMDREDGFPLTGGPTFPRLTENGTPSPHRPLRPQTLGYGSQHLYSITRGRASSAGLQGQAWTPALLCPRPCTHSMTKASSPSSMGQSCPSSWPSRTRAPTKKSHIHSLGPGRAQDGHSSDDPQGALRPNEQLLQVIACVVLPQGGQAVQDGAISQHLGREGSPPSHTDPLPAGDLLVSSSILLPLRWLPCQESQPNPRAPRRGGHS